MGDASRFNPYHGKAGTSVGGQFVSASGGSGSADKKPAAGHKTAAAPEKPSGDSREALLAQAHADLEQARTLEKELDGLLAQERSAHASAKKSAAHAAAAKKAGKVTAQHHHASQHAHHKHKASSLHKRITELRAKIKALRQAASALEARADSHRSAETGTERLHEYWVHGEGAAKIAWGAPGDFDRCVAHLGKFIDDPQGYCNLAHHAALGIYPATHAKELKGRSGMATDAKKPYGDVRYADPKNGKYPIDTAEHAKAAWSYINMPKNAAQYPMNGVTVSEVKDRIMAACRKFGIEISGDDSSRSDGPLPFVRSFPLEDIAIRAGGDGRTVEAYATVFDTPAPIHDQDGDYIEVIDRKAFDRILPKLAPSGGRASWRVGVFYNHAMTLHGTASEMDSMPIGVPLEIKADGRGLFTRTRYHKGDRADQVLEAIREGSISGYSFSGRFDRSQPGKPRGGFRPDGRGNLPTVRRTESTLREYGPTPFPAYQDAAITGVRAEQIAEQLTHVAELLRSGAPLDSPQFDEVLASGAPAWDSPSEDSHLVRSGRSVKEQLRAQRAAFLLNQHRSSNDRSSRPGRGY